jgi:general L-amino acid transport system permease protein
MSTPTHLVSTEKAPASSVGVFAWIRSQLFSSPINSLLTILSVWLLLATVPAMVDWFLINANATASTADECRQSKGACWAMIVEKHRLILFGLYPYDEQWRPLISTGILVSSIILSGWRKLWNIWLLVVWTVSLTVVAILMWGGMFGLTYVENTQWGGLGRRSNMPAIKTICIVYIELIRGVPLISMLFMSAVMLPLFLPEGMSIDKLLRAQIAIIIFAAAYMAETIRGGLQAIPKGQFEGAESLGLSYWQQMRLIVLPQALKIVIPPLVGLFIALFKDTSLVVIIGIFDLTQAAKAALTDSAWSGFSVEVYVFISAIYFVFCYSMSKYSQSLEKRLATGHER